MPILNTRAASVILRYPTGTDPQPVFGQTRPWRHRYVHPMQGIAYIDVAGVTPNGVGVLRAVGVNPTKIRWKPPGATAFGPDDVAADDFVGGFALVEGPDRNTFANLKIAGIPTDGDERLVFVQDEFNTGLATDDITAAQAAAGVTIDTVLEFLNANGLSYPVYDLRVWLDPAATNLSIRLNGAGGFTTPTTESAALVHPFLAFGATVPFEIRKTIAPGTASNPRAVSQVHYRFETL